MGEGGVLRAEDAFSVEAPITIERLRPGHPVEREVVNNFDAYARQVDAFAATLEDGAPFAAPGELGWRNQIVLDAIYRSLRTGAVQEIASTAMPHSG